MRTSWLLGAAMTLALATGCGDGSQDVTDVTDVGDVNDAEVQEIDLGAGYVLAAPATWALEQAFAVPIEEGDECGSVPASVEADGAFVSFGLPAAVCADEEQDPPLNGEHGDYVGIGDVPEPRSVSERPTDLGPATTFLQGYTECTNECVDSEDRVALISLDAPVAPDRPTLMVQVDGDRMDAATFAALLDGLHRAAGPSGDPTTTSPPGGAGS